MAGNSITFSKPTRDYAKANGKALFAYGFEDKHLAKDQGAKQGAKLGSAHLWTPMEPTRSS